MEEHDRSLEPDRAALGASLGHANATLDRLAWTVSKATVSEALDTITQAARQDVGRNGRSRNVIVFVVDEALHLRRERLPAEEPSYGFLVFDSFPFENFWLVDSLRTLAEFMRPIAIVEVSSGGGLLSVRMEVAELVDVLRTSWRVVPCSDGFALVDEEQQRGLDPDGFILPELVRRPENLNSLFDTYALDDEHGEATR